MARWCRIFDGSLDQLAEARRFVRLVAGGHEMTFMAELVVCELATNAVLHTDSGEASGRFVVEVEFGPESGTWPSTTWGRRRNRWPLQRLLSMPSAGVVCGWSSFCR